jgi:hypothetical protein
VDADRESDRARVGLGFAGGDAHQGRFARTVTTHQTDPFAFLNLEVEVVKNGRTAETDIDVEETE